jgi:hypothetical protein
MTAIVWIIFAGIVIGAYLRSRRFWARGLPKPGAKPADLAEFSRQPGQAAPRPVEGPAPEPEEDA